jgi:hypothetical protein
VVRDDVSYSLWIAHACLGDRYLLQNMDWLEEELGGFEDDYLIFDCPGMPTVFLEVRA